MLRTVKAACLWADGRRAQARAHRAIRDYDRFARDYVRAYQVVKR